MSAAMKRTLVVGGLEDFVRKSVGPPLAAYGLSLEWHWPQERMPPASASLPVGCEAVVALYEMVPNQRPIHQVRDAAKRLGLPFVAASRKKSIMYRDLAAAGLSPVGPHVAEALRAALPAVADQPHSPPQEEVTPMEGQPQNKIPSHDGLQPSANMEELVFCGEST